MNRAEPMEKDLKARLINKNISNFLIALLTLVYFLYYSSSNKYILALLQIAGVFVWITTIKLYYRYSGYLFDGMHILLIAGIGMGYYFSFLFLNWRSDEGLRLTIGMIIVSLSFYGSFSRFSRPRKNRSTKLIHQ